MFPLFNTAVDLAHHFWKKLLREGDSAVDATLGNGHDALFLAHLIKGGTLWGFDIQEKALKNSLEQLKNFSNICFFQESHDRMEGIVLEPVRLIVYNLGYLPGGDKSLTTNTESTLRSVEQGLHLLIPGGALSITCYPGHAEGEREEAALLELCAELDPRSYAVSHFRFINRKKAPSLILIQTERQKEPHNT